MSSLPSWSSSSRGSVNPSEPDLRISEVVQPLEAIRPSFIPEVIPCSLTSDDLSLIRIQYGIPQEYELELPGPSGRACSPPPGRFCLYLEAFHAGLRLPIHPFILSLFRFLNISFASIVPNSFRFVVGFLSLCILAEVPPTISLFRSFYTLKRHPTAKDWWYISPQFGRKGLLKGAPSSVHGWKDRFFFVSCPSLDIGLPGWGRLRESVRRAPGLERGDLDSSNKLKDYKVPLLSELLNAQTLFNLGLSPFNPKEMTPEEAEVLGKRFQSRRRKAGTSSEVPTPKRARADDPSSAQPAVSPAPVPAVPLSSAEPIAAVDMQMPPPDACERKKKKKKEREVAVRGSRPQKTSGEPSGGGIDWEHATLDDWRVVENLIGRATLPHLVNRLVDTDLTQRVRDSFGALLEISHQLAANVIVTDLRTAEASQAKAEAAKATEEASQAKEEASLLKAEVARQSAEVERLQQALKKEKLVAAELQVALSAAEEGKREAEANSSERERLAAEKAVAVFKASEEQKEIKISFAEEAFGEGFKLCRTKVAENLPDLDLSFLGGDSSGEEGDSPPRGADLPKTTADPAVAAPPAHQAAAAEPAPSSSRATPEV